MKNYDKKMMTVFIEFICIIKYFVRKKQYLNKIKSNLI